ncbi:conjugal transfer protein TrbL family protein [Cytobacillus sp. FSL M8-0252]|uniref:conjugal transfer protein TrbL family protein n=1 Tax=Cytobacillus sp. FSL M8-0252 TaxID=2921621 RepID=UPI0030F7ED86
MKKVIPLSLIVVLIFSIFTTTTAFADKGEFYEKYEDEFSDMPKGYQEFIEKFDADTMEFDCGKLDVVCIANSWQYNFALGFANFVALGTKVLVLEPETIVTDEGFTKYKNYLKTLSTIMLSLFLVWQIMIMVAKRFGDPDDYPQAMSNKLYLVVSGGILLGLYEPIFSYILRIQNLAISNLLESGLQRDDLFVMIFKYSPNFSIVFGIFVGLINIVFLLAIIYRFVAFGFFYVVGPIAIPTIVNEEFNYFQIWLRAIVNNLVTLFLQTLAFVLSLASMTGQLGFVKGLPPLVDMVVGFLLAIVFCFFALVIPSYLGNLGASTGTGRALGKLVRYSVLRR